MGKFGAFEIIIILGLVVLLIVILVTMSISRAKHKSRAKTLDNVLKQQQSKSSEVAYDQLEKLNKLRTSGALTDEEFEKEKKKILRG